MKGGQPHNVDRARGLRRFVRLASAVVVFGWLGVIFAVGTLASRGVLFTLGGLYQTVGMVAMVWFVMHMWALVRKTARSEQVLVVRGAWGRAADRVEAIVTKTEKALFRWTPYLCAVFWSLFGASLSTATSTKWYFGREQSSMYFWVAIVLTVILSNGIGEHRSGPAMGSASWRRRATLWILVIDAGLALAAGYFIWKFGVSPLVWALVVLFAAFAVSVTVGGLREIRATRQQEPPEPDQKSADSHVG